ncbi:MAG: YeeE/YedE family protein [Myxococcales bacterium]|nr:YeeE/YedE family protein [Myxococcales bacterium]MCB9549514.1 YeeE/YedE family protein [Myxococcales bacterium]
MKSLSLFAAGLMFAAGLALSGMTQPAKVIGFLDFFGAWDPALIFVMVGAIAVNFVALRFILRQPKPVFAASFGIPTRRDLDPRLIGGSAIFGVGWGLAGFCPGPALTSLPTLATPILVFVGFMLAGMALFDLVEHARIRRTSTSHG